jgi:hypothetical protein
MQQLGTKIVKMYTRYGSPGFLDSEGLKLVRKFKEKRVTEGDIKNLLYGSIRELTKDKRYYYESTYRPHWTDDGKKVIAELMDLYAEKIQTAIKQADEQRAKDMVFKTLKEE